MFLRILKRRAQTTAEYAVLIGLVIAAVIAMQVYVRRALQGKIKVESDQLGSQYEPYYLESHASTSRDTQEKEAFMEGGGITRELTTDFVQRNATQNMTAPE